MFGRAGQQIDGNPKKHSGSNLKPNNAPTNISISSHAVQQSTVDSAITDSVEGHKNDPTPVTGKRLLPPLPNSGRLTHPIKDRASQACDHCRKAKIKCSGTLPCVKCKADHRDCRYGETKKDGVVRQQKKMTLTNSTLKNSNKKLHDLLAEMLENSAISSQYVEQAKSVMIASAYDHCDYEMVDDGHSSLLGGVIKRKRSPSDKTRGEEDADADAGSTGSLDVVDQDLNRNEHTRAAGFIGKSSGISWVNRVQTVVSQDPAVHPEKSPPSAEPQGGTVEACYHAEESDFQRIDEESVNPLDWPEDHVVDRLIESYFRTINPVYPILIEADFMLELETLRQRNFEDGLTEDDQRSLRLLNLVFALSAWHAHMVKAPYVGADNDHLIYAMRAQKLGLDQRMLHKDYEVRNLLCMIVYAIYQISINQFNRAWTTIGSTVRHAQALGLHLRMDIPDLSDKEQELRSRIWWTIFNLEAHVDEVLGRPSCIAEHFISARLPLNIEQETLRDRDHLFTPFYKSQVDRHTASATASRTPASLLGKLGSHTKELLTSSFAFSFPITVLTPTFSTLFILRTQLSMITFEILSCVFAPPLQHARWSDVQRLIGTLEERMDEWRWSLPVVFNFTITDHVDTQFKNQRNGLSMFYYSSRMLLFRSTLCMFSAEGNSAANKDESSDSKRWNSRAAGECVAAAGKLIDRLPEPHDWRRLYDMMPWFSTLHYLVEGASVILLELAYRAAHVPAQTKQLVQRAKKAVRLLGCMSAQSSSARKAWEIFNELLKQVVPRVGLSVDDMPADAPAPPYWSGQRFGRSSSKPSDRQVMQNAADSQESKNYATANWVDNYSSTPRFSAPPLPEINPSTHSENFMSMYDSAMQDVRHFGQFSVGCEPRYDSWQGTRYPTFGDPYSYSPDAALPTTLVGSENLLAVTTPQGMGGMSSSSNMDSSSGYMSSQTGTPYMPQDGQGQYHPSTAYDCTGMSSSGYIPSIPAQQQMPRGKYQQWQQPPPGRHS